jgi:hypothetical protein
VEGGLLIFESRSTKDYHEEMEGISEVFCQGLPCLEVNTVTENAPYNNIPLW